MEEAKRIKDFPNYLLFNDGTIKNNKGSVLKTHKNNKGYLLISLSNNGKAKSHYLHRLVAIHFILNPEKKPEVNHKDGNKYNNRFDNLEWTDRSGNMKHAYKNGLINRKGSNNTNSKLSLEQVEEIRMMYSKKTEKEIAAIFKISTSHVRAIYTRRAWKT